MGTEPTITVSYTQRGALLVRHALKAFMAQERLSDTDQTGYQLLVDAVVWTGPNDRMVTMPDAPSVPRDFADPRWRAAYMAGYKARRRQAS